MLQSILLATDFRDSSQEAANVTAKIASTFGSRVTVFHVLEPFPMWPVPPHEAQRLLVERLANQQVKLGDSLIGYGPAADTIVQKAEELGVDLIVIGTGEKLRFDRLAVGPIAAAVIEHAIAPVLAVRAEEPRLAFQKVLCPVDQSRVSRQGLDNAIRLTKGFGGELIVLSVIPEVNWLTAAVETGQFRDAKIEYEIKWRAELDDFLKPVSFDGVRWNLEVRLGDPHQQIVSAAKEHHADLIVMGATGRTGIVRVLLGSVTRRVLQELPCSLLTVKQEDLIEELLPEDFYRIQRLMEEGRKLLAGNSAAEALAKFRQVLARDPFHVGAVESRAEAHEKLGQVQEAEFYRRRAKKLREGGWA
jgi:nucleotide-binding universal stress UspA family protein